jgi:hypothetical protein
MHLIMRNKQENKENSLDQRVNAKKSIPDPVQVSHIQSSKSESDFGAGL